MSDFLEFLQVVVFLLLATSLLHQSFRLSRMSKRIDFLTKRIDFFVQGKWPE